MIKQVPDTNRPGLLLLFLLLLLGILASFTDDVDSGLATVQASWHKLFKKYHFLFGFLLVSCFFLLFVCFLFLFCALLFFVLFFVCFVFQLMSFPGPMLGLVSSLQGTPSSFLELQCSDGCLMLNLFLIYPLDIIWDPFHV